MLKLPNLDDRMYDQMVEEARKQIPALYPNWTDENAHDPGITMVELFSWLIEMQQYYLDQITESNERKFLKLLGVTPKPASAASAEIHFAGVTAQTAIPRGTRLLAGEQVFETGEPILLVPVAPDKLVVRTAAGSFDYTSSNEGRNVAFPAFGADAQEGSVLYIGFQEPLPAEELLSLSIRLYEQYPIQPVKDVHGERIPSARLEWLYYIGEANDEDGDGWRRVTLERDETNQLSQSGKLLFRLPQPMQQRLLQAAGDRPRYWICCRLLEAGFELPPKMDQIAVNAVKAYHHRTHSWAEVFDWYGETGQQVVSDHYLTYYGRLRVQVRQEHGGWQDWTQVEDLEICEADERVYQVIRDDQSMQVIVRFGNAVHGCVPPAGRGRIRLISWEESFESSRWVGSGTGVPNQRLDHLLAPSLSEGVQLQVGSRDKSGEWIWHDWHQVADFDSSGPEDRHYVLHAQSGTILFGNNEQGQVPDKAREPNIVLIRYRTGGGEAGNVNVGLIQRFSEPWQELSGIVPTNRTVAEGGAEAETLPQAKRRAQLALQQPATAVTAEDVERVVLRTPGLRIARVCAIPLYDPGLRNYPKEKAPGRLTVVVVPYSERPRPMPSKGFRETVERHLDRHRLLSTEVKVIGPEYVQISIHAVVIVEPHFKDERAVIVKELNRLLQPFDNLDGSTGWEFGRTVYKGDIYGAINRIPGVSYIQDIWISTEGKGIRKEASGDIILPPSGLVCSGEHDVELISISDL